MYSESVFPAVILCACLATTPAFADVKVVTSIKPVQSLVAAVMQGAGSPALLVKGAASPHSYALKPSDAESLSNADLVFWIGPDLESFMAKSVETLSSSEKAVALIAAPGVTVLPPRSGPSFADDGDHDTVDPHIWLDPENAKAMITSIAASLSRVDPEHDALYKANAEKENTKITDLERRFQERLKPLGNKGFIVFHDAYQYFEKAFGLKAVGAISIHPENPPSAAGLIALREELKSNAAVCAFSEPQFDQRLVEVIIEGTNAKRGILDPEGAKEEPGPELYFNVMEALATSLEDCLSS